jgi:hypothetical protein
VTLADLEPRAVRRVGDSGLYTANEPTIPENVTDGASRRRKVGLGVASLLVVSLLLLGANAFLMLTSTATETTLAVWLIAPLSVVVLLAAVVIWV